MRRHTDVTHNNKRPTQLQRTMMLLRLAQTASLAASQRHRRVNHRALLSVLKRDFHRSSPRFWTTHSCNALLLPVQEHDPQSQLSWFSSALLSNLEPKHCSPAAAGSFHLAWRRAFWVQQADGRVLSGANNKNLKPNRLRRVRESEIYTLLEEEKVFHQRCTRVQKLTGKKNTQKTSFI